MCYVISIAENLNRLKKLEYLNVSLNNLEAIENLEGCESLKKLDLTCNFIALENVEKSVKALRANLHLRQLFLVGNPCMLEWGRCRMFVVSVLTQLVSLDGVEITYEERVEAVGESTILERELREEILKRTKEKTNKNDNDSDNNNKEDKTWSAEKRYALFLKERSDKNANEQEHEMERKIHGKKTFEREKKPPREGFDALPENTDALLQVSEGKYDFIFENDDLEDEIVLRVQIPKHYDTSLVDVDYHSDIIRVLIKGELLLLRLPEKVNEEQCNAARSKTTGELKISMTKSSLTNYKKSKKKMMIAKTAGGVNDNNNNEDSDTDDDFMEDGETFSVPPPLFN